MATNEHWARRPHVGIIMDGNGRWATRRGLPRSAGHREGARVVREVVEAAPDLGIGTLTLFAFSTENWQRPRGEVEPLLATLEAYLVRERRRCRENGVRLAVIGRRDRIGRSLRRESERAARATESCTRLLLRIAVDYSARESLRDAARAAGAGALDDRAFRRALLARIHSPAEVPDVDLLVRTGGEQRLSDFLLWECAWAELLFLDRPWPEFTGADLAAAVDELRRRERRFGAVPAAGGSVGGEGRVAHQGADEAVRRVGDRGAGALVEVPQGAGAGVADHHRRRGEGGGVAGDARDADLVDQAAEVGRGRGEVGSEDQGQRVVHHRLAGRGGGRLLHPVDEQAQGGAAVDHREVVPDP